MKYWPGMILVVAVGAVAAIALWPDGQPGMIPYRDDDAVARGKQLYAENCAGCHGDRLQGQPDWQMPLDDLRYPAPPHDATGHTWHHPDQYLFMVTKYGTAALMGDGRNSDMAGFGDRLSDEEILQILAYIKSTWPEDIQRQHDTINARAAAGG